MYGAIQKARFSSFFQKKRSFHEKKEEMRSENFEEIKKFSRRRYIANDKLEEMSDDSQIK